MAVNTKSPLFIALRLVRDYLHDITDFVRHSRRSITGDDDARDAILERNGLPEFELRFIGVPSDNLANRLFHQFSLWRTNMAVSVQSRCLGELLLCPTVQIVCVLHEAPRPFMQ